MAPRKKDLEIAGSEYSVDLAFTGNQVPPPPTERTSAEIEQELKEVKALFQDLQKGFGKTTLTSFGTLSAFESAKAQAYTLLNETLPAELKERKDWDNKYRVKVSQIFGDGATVLSADEVYQYQQTYKAATNPNDPELKAYDNAVKAVNDLRTKINTPGSKESKLAPMDQQLLLASELKKVQAFITPRVVELRSQNIPLEIDKNGRTLRSTSFALVNQVDSQINRTINEGVRIAERVYGTLKPTATLYGQPAELTTIRDEEQTRQLNEFMDRANTLRGETPSQAGAQPVAYTPPPATTGGGRPASATITPTGASQRAIDAQGQRYAAMAGQAPAAPPPPSGAGAGAGAGAAGVGGAGGGAGTGRVGAGGTIGGGTAETAKFKVGDWQAVLQDQYPGYSKDWIAANATSHFGQDFINLMVEASKPNGKYLGLTTEASVNAFKKDLKQTNYWRTTETSAKRFDESIDVDRQRLINNKKLEIASAYGDVSFDDATLTQLATNAARLGLTGSGLQQAVYSGALKPGAGGSRTALAGRVLQGADADRIRGIGRGWNTKITDAQVQAILTGQADPSTGIVLTEDGLREQLQAKWKGALPHLRDQFDAGLNLDQIGSSYRSYAAQLLETPEDQINMFEGPYLQAFDNGQGSQLSLSQWVEKVKTDPRFGWQFTKAANQQATDIGLTLARAFGKVS
jgi:hypothetical protein